MMQKASRHLQSLQRQRSHNRSDLSDLNKETMRLRKRLRSFSVFSERGFIIMAVLEQLEPKEVFHFFEEICRIPHGSDNLQQISDYLVQFAKDRNLEVVQDNALNVIIRKPASKGYEDRDPIILQGHMDMVAVSDPDADIDMKKDSLRLETDGEFVWAKGTSLGGDDGIAVAYSLALLDSDTILHPLLEVVITTNEETGMDGARAIDLSGLKGRQLLNMDNEEEGVLLTSCAGGGRFHSYLSVNRIKRSGTAYNLEITGLLGGHSGEMIIKGRGNANCLMGRLLTELREKVDFSIVDLSGGVADNAIPRSAQAKIILPQEVKADALLRAVKQTENAVYTELELKDPGVKFNCMELEKGTFECLDETSLKKVSELICSLPNGVQAMSGAIVGLVETSLNLGIMKLDKELLTLEFSVRSSIESSKNNLFQKLEMITEAFGGRSDITGAYPGWAYKQDSKLRSHMIEVYQKLYGKEPAVVAIHAGVECGLFSEKISGLDCISIGPDMQDIHTTGEKLSVASTKRTWEYIKAVLE